MRARAVLVACLFLSLLAGCVSGSVHRADLKKAPPADMKFDTYLYEAGRGGLYRVVYLHHPDSPVPVKMNQPDITVARGTYADAMLYMTKAAGPIRIDTETVTYQGKLAGYLITQHFISIERYPLEISLTDRGNHLFLHIRDLQYDLHKD